MTHAPRSIIFDLDGTLVNTLADLTTALNRALQSRGRPTVDAPQVRRSVGDGATMLCRRVAPDADDAEIAALRGAFAEEYRRRCLEQTRLYPGVAAVLESLHQGGIRMGVLSNKPDEFTRTIVAALCRPDWFVAVRGAENEAGRKPSPRVALQIAGQLGTAPPETLLIGDSTVDIATARAAGMIAAAVTWGFRSAEELAAAGPDHLISRPHEIPPLMGIDE